MEEAAPPQKSKKVPILIAASLALALGSVMFALTFTGTIAAKNPLNPENESDHEMVEAEELPPLEFLQIEPLMISLGAAAGGKQLRFEGYLEVNPTYQDEVIHLMPRIMDVLNTYLRAVDYSDVQEPNSLLRLRLQMLRRVQIVTGDGRVNDLLVSKFLLS